MNDRFNRLLSAFREFRDERDWKPFHTPKNLCLSLLIEAGELAEHFQWKDEKEIQEMIQNDEKLQEISEEVADLLF